MHTLIISDVNKAWFVYLFFIKEMTTLEIKKLLFAGEL